MEALNGMSGAEAAEYLMNNLTNEEEYATLNDGNNHKVENVPAGYYLIVDVTENLPAYETKSAYILQVLESEVRSVTLLASNSTSRALTTVTMFW